MASLVVSKTRKSKRQREKRLWNPVNPITPLQKARAVIGSLVKTLQEDDFQKRVGIEVTEVFKGGSMGHGTTVPGKFDIDLVLYSRTIIIKKAVEEGYEKYLDQMNEYLRDKLKYTCKYTHEDFTDVAIKFSIQRPGESSIDVDLILSPYFSDHNELLTALITVPSHMRLKMFSVSASKYQTDFIRHQHIWVKEFIRRAKAWRNIEWSVSQDGKPKSYLMSILVIIAFDRMPTDMTTVERGGMRKLVPLMTEALQEVVNDIASNDDLDLSVPGADSDLLRSYSMLLPPCPRLIDPANPANNLYLSGIQRSIEDDKWTPLKEKIRRLNLTSAIMY